MDNSFLINFKKDTDYRGNLVAIEENNPVPFNIKRIFYIYGCNEDTVRGGHANLNSKFLLICLTGSVKIKTDDGKIVSEYTLDKPDIGLYISNMVWKEMYDFSQGSILLCLSSEIYNPDEYIKEYNKFLEVIKS